MRIVTVLFDSRTAADQARADLIARLSMPAHDITIHAQQGAEEQAGGGFMATLKNLFMPEEDRSTYAEGVRRGGIMLSANVPDDAVDQAMDILDRDGAVDVDHQAESWRDEGWGGAGAQPMLRQTGTGRTAIDQITGGQITGGQITGGPTTERAGGMDDVPLSPAPLQGALTIEPGAAGAAGATAPAHPQAATAGEQSIPLVEETLRVGKREVERGRVRVRSYVIETPVEEQVTLHSETVQIERRPVDRQASAAETELFRERTLEAVETAEEAVVAKDVRVTDELVLHKQTVNTTQTVRDTVRHTEVDIEDTTRPVPGRV